jgi:hypothetical protein
MDHSDQVIRAVEEFSVNNRDEKAQLEAKYAVTNNGVRFQSFDNVLKH